MKTKQPLLVISIIFAFSLACQTLVKPFATENNAPTQTQEAISQPTAVISPTETPAGSVSYSITEVTDDFGVSMMLVSEGEFTMGSDIDNALAECQKYRSDCKSDWFTGEAPAHHVYLNAFYIDKYEVTNATYKICVASGICDPPRDPGPFTPFDYNENSKYDNYPIVNVDWNQAKTYCEWRSSGLPTEAQWEKAAQGSDGGVYPWGTDKAECNKANIATVDSSGGITYCVGGTTEVGSYESDKSPYGVYDMAGNVHEWVADWYADTYYQNSPSSNPMGPDTGEKRVLRGGGWNYSETSVRISSRGSYDPNEILYDYFGFRCARTP